MTSLNQITNMLIFSMLFTVITNNVDMHIHHISLDGLQRLNLQIYSIKDFIAVFPLGIKLFNSRFIGRILTHCYYISETLNAEQRIGIDCLLEKKHCTSEHKWLRLVHRQNVNQDNKRLLSSAFTSTSMHVVKRCKSIRKFYILGDGFRCT